MPKPAKRRVRKPAAKPRVKAVSTVRATSMGGRARTIIYVHGIGNKPPAAVLKCQWDQALFGFDLGDKSRLAYWVDRVRYPRPSPGTCHNPDLNQLPQPEQTFGVSELRARATADAVIPPEAAGKERDILRKIARETLSQSPPPPSVIRSQGIGVRVLPLPSFLRDFFTRQVTKLFLRDVNVFLFDQERREFMRQTLFDRIESGGGPFVEIGRAHV